MIKDFQDKTISDENIKRKYNIEELHWTLTNARNDVQNNNTKIIKTHFRIMDYRLIPFTSINSFSITQMMFFGYFFSFFFLRIERVKE